MTNAERIRAGCVEIVYLPSTDGPLDCSERGNSTSVAEQSPWWQATAAARIPCQVCATVQRHLVPPPPSGRCIQCLPLASCFHFLSCKALATTTLQAGSPAGAAPVNELGFQP